MRDQTTTEPTLTADGFQLSAARDLPDLRDQIYRPTLRVLLPRMERDDHLFYPKARSLRIAVRDQGSTPTCTGQALAALIDIMRLKQAPGDSIEAASACMLYRLAREYELGLAADSGLLSLRSVIKAFYHHGVCPDGLVRLPYGRSGDTGLKPHHWSFLGNGDCDDPVAPGGGNAPLSVPHNFLTVDRAKAARKVPLGAYYRIRPQLNDYHAALNEAGAVLVSAHIHEGWLSDRVEEAKGQILYRHDRPLGVHAFVVIGYNDRGFLVLNSWGRDWGGHDGYGGIALWQYSDWADSIQDGWVLRLGVSTPGAFRYSIGEQGVSFSHPAQGAPAGSPSTGSTPCLELLGHFAHLDDGQHVTRGAYATSVAAVAETIRYLGGSPRWPQLTDDKASSRMLGRDTAPIISDDGDREGYQGVLLWLGGSLEGIKDAVTIAANRKDTIKAAALYPYTVFWCNDFVTDTTAVLTRLFEEVKTRIGRSGPAFDQAIENASRGVGRAFWRDISTGAAKATRRDSHGAMILDSFLSLKGLTIHVVVEDAGAIFLDRYLHALADHPDRDGWLDNIRSIDFVTPSIALREIFEKSYWQNLFRRFGGNGPARRSARLWVPSAEIEQRLCVDVYGRSIQHLIANAFERGLPGTQIAAADFMSDDGPSELQKQRGLLGEPLLGMATATSAIREQAAARNSSLLQQLEILEIPPPAGAYDRLNQQRLLRNPGFFKTLLNAVVG